MKVRADIAALLHQGMTNMAVAQQLHCDPKTVATARRALGIPRTPAGSRPRPLTDLINARTEAAEDGHLRWTGTVNRSGTPVLNYQGSPKSAHALMFRLRYGRGPVGKVRTACDYPGCLAHIEDRPMRQKNDALYAAIFGGQT